MKEAKVSRVRERQTYGTGFEIREEAASMDSSPGEAGKASKQLFSQSLQREPGAVDLWISAQ